MRSGLDASSLSLGCRPGQGRPLATPGLGGGVFTFGEVVFTGFGVLLRALGAGYRRLVGGTTMGGPALLRSAGVLRRVWVRSSLF